MVGAIVSGATALAKIGTSIYGAYKSSQLGKQAKETEDRTHNTILSQLTSRANEDYVNRSEIQGVLGKVRDQLADRYKRARATNIVAGGSDESIAMMQQADNQLIADATSSVASGASTYKDKVLDAINEENKRYGKQAADRLDGQATQVATQVAETNKSLDGIAKAFA